METQFSPVQISDSGSVRKSNKRRRETENPEGKLCEKLYHSLLEKTKDKDWVLRADGKYHCSVKTLFEPTIGRKAMDIGREVCDLFKTRPVKGIICESFEVRDDPLTMTLWHTLILNLAWKGTQ